jgi:hypothetical protein
VTLIGFAAIAFDPSLSTRAVAPLLLTQVFAGATGFAVPARRGYYDLVLTRGDNRWRIGLMHWGLSAWAGVAGWMVLACAEMAAGGSDLRASSTLVALLLVSTIPWAANVRLQRLTAGLAWVVIGFVATVLRSGGAPVLTFVQPWLLPGASWTVRESIVAWAAAGTVSVAAMTLALRWIATMDVALESAQ